MENSIQWNILNYFNARAPREESRDYLMECNENKFVKVIC